MILGSSTTLTLASGSVRRPAWCPLTRSAYRSRPFCSICPIGVTDSGQARTPVPLQGLAVSDEHSPDGYVAVPRSPVMRDTDFQRRFEQVGAYTAWITATGLAAALSFDQF